MIKNSWWDGLPPAASWTQARGSHTLGYFLQRHSDADERSVCPNVHSPRSWYSCDDLFSCRKPQTQLYANTIRKVLRLECIDDSPFAKGICKKGARYFLKRIAPWGDEPGNFGGGLSFACMIEDDPDVVATATDPSGGVTRRRGLGGADSTAGGADVGLCTPPLPLDDLALIFTPIAEEIVPNDPDQCGFYFMPYEILETLSVRFGGMFATELDVKWDARSYAANAAADGGSDEGGSGGGVIDWTLVTRDTREQANSLFGGGAFPDIQTPTRAPTSG